MRLRIFLRLWLHGEPYYMLPRFDWKGSWFIAGVEAKTIRQIRADE